MPKKKIPLVYTDKKNFCYIFIRFQTLLPSQKFPLFYEDKFQNKDDIS